MSLKSHFKCLLVMYQTMETNEHACVEQLLVDCVLAVDTCGIAYVLNPLWLVLNKTAKL